MHQAPNARSWLAMREQDAPGLWLDSYKKEAEGLHKALVVPPDSQAHGAECWMNPRVSLKVSMLHL